MKISGVEAFQADGGWRPFSFLKLTTDAGLVGWAEYTESARNRGLTVVIRNLVERIVGEDPRAFGRICATLSALTRLSTGGINQQAIAAIENACIDITAKALGVPVYALFGGPVRDRIPLYWSHCGNFRVRHAEYFQKVLGTAPIRTLDDLKRLGQEAIARGFRAIKSSPIVFEPGGPRMINPGFTPGLDFAQIAEARIVDAIATQLTAFREGLGPHAGLLMDLNFSFRPEGLRRIARAVESSRLTWLEMDVLEPSALASIRSSTATPIGSLETVLGRRACRPYFEAQSVDVAIIDVLWNGLWESVKMAAMAESYELNIAPHNGNGPLADLMSAHLCAVAPNVHIMEMEVDDVPWKDALLDTARIIENGTLMVPSGPGWGAQINEEALAAHPWETRALRTGLKPR
jgi:galactonate dehydratase